jgi:hypothetical protein
LVEREMSSKPEVDDAKQVAQPFQPAGSRDPQADVRLPVPCFRSGTGDWKVTRTRRQGCLRYVTLRWLRHSQLQISGSCQLPPPQKSGLRFRRPLALFTNAP